MFTGIITNIGQVQSVAKDSNYFKLGIQEHSIYENSVIGDSICVDGVCLSVVAKEEPTMYFELSTTTRKISTFDDYEIGQKVNLEEALRLNDKLGGHIVQGHIDGCAKLMHIDQQQDFCVMEFAVDMSLAKYICYKGSISLNGISLTIAECSRESFTVAIIPYTLEHTNLYLLQVGQKVHIETDMLSRYLERLSQFPNHSTDKR